MNGDRANYFTKENFHVISSRDRDPAFADRLPALNATVSGLLRNIMHA